MTPTRDRDDLPAQFDQVQSKAQSGPVRPTFTTEDLVLSRLTVQIEAEIAVELRQNPCLQNLPRLRHLQAALDRVRTRQSVLRAEQGY